MIVAYVCRTASGPVARCNANGVGNNRVLIDRLRRADDGATPSNRSAAVRKKRSVAKQPPS